MRLLRFQARRWNVIGQRPSRKAYLENVALGFLFAKLRSMSQSTSDSIGMLLRRGRYGGPVKHGGPHTKVLNEGIEGVAVSLNDFLTLLPLETDLRNGWSLDASVLRTSHSPEVPGSAQGRWPTTESAPSSFFGRLARRPSRKVSCQGPSHEVALLTGRLSSLAQHYAAACAWRQATTTNP